MMYLFPENKSELSNLPFASRSQNDTYPEMMGFCPGQTSCVVGFSNFALKCAKGIGKRNWIGMKIEGDQQQNWEDFN